MSTKFSNDYSLRLKVGIIKKWHKVTVTHIGIGLRFHIQNNKMFVKKVINRHTKVRQTRMKLNWILCIIKFINKTNVVKIQYTSLRDTESIYKVDSKIIQWINFTKSYSRILSRFCVEKILTILTVDQIIENTRTYKGL